MLVRPLPGVDRHGVLEALDHVAAELTQFGSGTHTEVYRAYNEWAIESASYLRGRISQEDIDRLILTRRYWTLQTVSLEHGPVVNLLLHTEMGERARELRDAREELRKEIDRWSVGRAQLVVPDTGVFLQHRNKFDEVDWAQILGVYADAIRLVIPIVVVDELDGRKRQGGHVGWRAGYSIAKVDELFRHSNPAESTPQLRPADWPQEATSSDRRTCGEVIVQMVFETPGHQRLPITDDEIVDQTLAIQSLSGQPVHLVTFDTKMHLRARAAGLKVHKLGDDDLSDEAKPKPYVKKQVPSRSG
jgi:hypothetical protein